METILMVCPHQQYIPFKSYYVVWKRFSATNRASAVPGLNRTMQYGNSDFSQLNQHPKEFKSYYVVWKQDMKKKIKEMEEQFKSYYVVWKLN